MDPMSKEKQQTHKTKNSNNKTKLNKTKPTAGCRMTASKIIGEL